MTTTLTARLGGIVLYPWNIVTVPVYVPLQFGAATRQVAVTVTASGDGPHVASPPGLTVSLILAGLLTEVWKATSLTFGAHFTKSPTLPELPMPALPENVMVTGLVDQIAFEPVELANPTAA